MNIHDDSILIKAYNRLLVDIRDKSEVPLGVPDDITCEWLLKEAPLLDKWLLRWLEHEESNYQALVDKCLQSEPESSVFDDLATVIDAFKCAFPEWLEPLVDEFLFNLRFPDYDRASKCVGWLRQLFLFCYKAEYAPTTQQIDEAQTGFIECDDGCAVWGEAFTSCYPSPLFRHTRDIIGRVIGQIDWKALDCSHGPGSVYPPSLPREKSKFLVIYDTIQSLYPFDQYFCGLPGYTEDHLRYELSGKVAEHSSIEAKLVCVPKDSRGPRLICVHPKEAVWIQQGQRRLLENAVSRSKAARRGINFSDQSVNGNLALAASASRDYVTLDLREASDRLSCELVSYLFGWAYQFLACSRASHVKLIDGRVRFLRKYAPMGNATVFPVQSIIFWALVRAGIKCHYGENCNDVYVFGDDIIYPSKYHEGALQALIRAGLVPNSSKTFVKGFFRESCGVDAYRGKDVTPLRMKAWNVATVSGLVAICDLAKRLRLAGYEETASCLYAHASRRVGRLSLNNNPKAQGVYEYVDYDFGKLHMYEDLRFNRSLQKWEAPSLLVQATVDRMPKSSWWNLQDSLLRLRELYKHGDRSTVESFLSKESLDYITRHRHLCRVFGIPYKPEEALRDAGCSDRGLEYTVPYRARLKHGWTEIRQDFPQVV